MVAAMLSAVGGIGALLLTLLFRDQVGVSRGLSRTVGFSMLLVAVALFLWGSAHLRGGLAGVVAPELAGLVTGGPFRLVRHPTYVAMSLAMTGVSVASRSVVGLVAVGILFLPAAILRARLEERALQQVFGEAWQTYASRVGFFIPGVGKLPRPE